MLTIKEVDATEPGHTHTIRHFNNLCPDIFPPLTDQHLETGHWWIAYAEHGWPIGMAGMVPFLPFENVGYLKRAYVLPDFRGHGIQLRFMFMREAKSAQLGWKMLVSECGAGNEKSAANFIKAGYTRVEPEQPWGERGSLYFAKVLA